MAPSVENMRSLVDIRTEVIVPKIRQLYGVWYKTCEKICVCVLRCLICVSDKRIISSSFLRGLKNVFFLRGLKNVFFFLRDLQISFFMGT